MRVAKAEYKSLLIEASDTDIIVIAMSHMATFVSLGMTKWIAFGKGEHTGWILIHDLASALGPAKTMGILFFHAFSGCDSVSGFKGKDKRTAW